MDYRNLNSPSLDLIRRTNGNNLYLPFVESVGSTEWGSISRISEQGGGVSLQLSLAGGGKGIRALGTGLKPKKSRYLRKLHGINQFRNSPLTGRSLVDTLNYAVWRHFGRRMAGDFPKILSLHPLIVGKRRLPATHHSEITRLYNTMVLQHRFSTGLGE